MRKLVTSALLVLIASFAAAQETNSGMDRQVYERANAMLPWNMRKRIHRLDFAADWTGQGDVFMYRVEDRGNSRFYLVDPSTGRKVSAFDNEKLAAALSNAIGEPIDAQDLPINRYYRNYHQLNPFPLFNLGWQKNHGGFSLELDQARTVTCSIPEYACELHTIGAWPVADGRALLSPDGRFGLRLSAFDLVLVDRVTGNAQELTGDGTEYYAYGKTASGIQDLSVKRLGLKFSPVARWSPDSARFVTHRYDERDVGFHHIVEADPGDGSMRPRHWQYKYAIPGDEHLPRSELWVFDVPNGRRVPLKMDAITTPHNASIIELNRVWWSSDSARLFILETDRYHKTVWLKTADALTGDVRTILRESAEPSMHFSTSRAPHVTRVVGDGDEVIWYSERDGWPHLYLYDGQSGVLKNRITEGAWIVQKIVHVDEGGRLIYFLAAGREPGRGPYRQHLYRIRFDGTGLELLTPENAHHRVSMSPSGHYFTDTFSTVESAPRTVLRDRDGVIVADVDAADTSELEAAGWRPPEPFRVKAADGETDVFGIIVKPSTFSPDRKYPVVDAIYPAPGRRVPDSFAEYVDSTSQAQAVAELGFVVVLIDGRGSSHRERDFRNFVFANYHDAGLGDHVAGIRQLAKSRPYMDLDRVGVYGHSNGGTNTIRAILNYPDFYHTAVASAASSDRRMHTANYELTVGPLSTANAEPWRLQNTARPELVESFKGNLLIVMGELDGNVHPAHAIRFMAEMIRQNKDFDFLLMPGTNHDFKPHPWFIRKRWDYFVTHLLGKHPPSGFNVDAEETYVHPPLLFRPPSADILH